jgi:hypothetical protein
MHTDGRHDVVLFLLAIDLTIRLLRLQQVTAVERALGQAPALRQTALAEIVEMRQDFALLGPLFERWIVAGSAIAQHGSGVRLHNKFSTIGRLLRLREYQLATAQSREFLVRPSQEKMPTAAIGGCVFIIECQRADDGDIYARVAELEAPRT